MSLRAIVLTSTALRHQFVVNRLAAELHVVGVWQEEKSFKPEQYATGEDDEAVIRRHFQARDASEREYFATDDRLQLESGSLQRHLPPGACNDAAQAELMASVAPDVVIVFGTGILREQILSRFDGRIINLHLGLSPYYRGAGTNFWPLVNRAPEYVGATIHYLDAGIDSGPIIAHVRPEIRLGDGPHDIGNRTIAAAVDVLARAARAHVEGGLEHTPQAGAGLFYRRKDFSADATRRLYRQFETGMVQEYLQHKPERDARITLLSLKPLAASHARPPAS